jgi:hypothetical protein
MGRFSGKGREVGVACSSSTYALGRTPDRWLVIVECADEKAQAEALRLCQQHGLECKAVMS